MYNWENWTEFNTQEQFTQCYNDIVGTWVWSFFDIISGLTYHHDVTITSQSGGTFTGTGGYPSGGPYTDTFVVNGTINKDQIQYTIAYVTGNVGYTINASGMVSPWGAWGMNWNSNTGQTGFWYSMSGGSTTVGCEGKGMINYRNDYGYNFKADVKYVNVVGTNAYFAGKVTKTNQPWMIGQWAVFGVQDGGEPGVPGVTVNLYRVRTVDEAIQQANSLPFGLHAAVFTRDVDLASASRTSSSAAA